MKLLHQRLIQCVCLAFWCTLASLAQAQDYPPGGFVQIDAEISPHNTFEVVHFKKAPQDYSSDSQIWLHALKPEFKTQLLFTHNSRASWLISEDEEFMAVNHHVMSDLGLMYVFVKDKEGLFQEVKKDFNEVTSKLMANQLKLKKPPVFDHFYCYADAWLRGGRLLAHLEGHYSGIHYLEEWYFVYDVKKDGFSWDLSEINKGAFQLVKPEDE